MCMQFLFKINTIEILNFNLVLPNGLRTTGTIILKFRMNITKPKIWENPRRAIVPIYTCRQLQCRLKYTLLLKTHIHGIRIKFLFIFSVIVESQDWRPHAFVLRNSSREADYTHRHKVHHTRALGSQIAFHLLCPPQFPTECNPLWLLFIRPVWMMGGSLTRPCLSHSF